MEMLALFSKKQEQSAIIVKSQGRTIELVDGMKPRDATRKMKQMESELIQKRQQLDEYKKEHETIRRILYPMLEKEYYFNQDIAEPVFVKHGVHPVKKEFQNNINSPVKILEAINWSKHCNENPPLEEMKRVMDENSSLKLKMEELTESIKNTAIEKEKELENYKEEIRNKFKLFQEKYQSLQMELENKKLKLEQVTTSMKIAPETPKIDEESIEVTKEDLVAKEVTEMEFNHEFNEILDDMNHSDVEVDMDLETLEEMPCVHLLKQQGYQVESSHENPQYDYLVENVPLRYFFYDINNADEFEEIMRHTNKMYFVFDDKKRLRNVNSKFTAWLIRQKERKSKILFSFTTLEQLKEKGLNKLEAV